jgi:hypothetical protein
MNDLKTSLLFWSQFLSNTGILCILRSVLFGVCVPLIVGEAIDANWTSLSLLDSGISRVQGSGASVISSIFLFLQRRILGGMSRSRVRPRKDFTLTLLTNHCHSSTSIAPAI